MSVVNENSFSAQDITSEYEAYTLQAPRDSFYWITVYLSQLNGAAANITINVKKKIGPQYRIAFQKVRAKPVATDNSFYYTLEQPVFAEKDSYMKVTVQSSNGSDTSCGGCIYIVDPYADSYDANDRRQVDAVTVGGSSPLSSSDIETAVQNKLDANDLHLVADANGRVDLSKIAGSATLVAQLENAIKLLVNKAIQNKSTGAIAYYDDDNTTVILTHTPTDGESDITRTPS